MKPSILKHFGLPDNYREQRYRGGPYQQFLDDLVRLIHNNAMVSLVGDTTAGKTVMFLDVIRSLGEFVKVVRVRSLDKERLRIAAIVNALLFDLSTESIRHDFEARSRQLRRVLGTTVVENKRRVVLVIENAHRLHGNTLLALKELREMDFAGRDQLFGIMLIGQSSLKSKVDRLKEIKLRTDFVEMNAENGWMTFQERKKFLKTLYGDLLGTEVRAQAALSASLPGEMIELVESKMESAYFRGKSSLDISDFDIPLDKMKEASGLSNEEIARETGIDRSTVSRIVNNKYQNPKLRKIVSEVIEKAALSKESDDKHKEAI
jgi:hypothetical protein